MLSASPVKFFVIIPAYNAGQYIKHALDSLIAQSYTAWECLVIDDGSTDDTALAAHFYSSLDQRIQVLSQPNMGVAGALNTGLRNIPSGDQWVSILSADDYYRPHKFKELYKYIVSNPEANFVYHGFMLRDETSGGATVGFDSAQRNPQKGMEFLCLLTTNYINGICTTMSGDLIKKVGFFKLELRYSQDYDYMLRAASISRPHFLDKDLSVSRMHAKQNSRNESAEAKGLIDTIFSIHSCLKETHARGTIYGNYNKNDSTPEKALYTFAKMIAEPPVIQLKVLRRTLCDALVRIANTNQAKIDIILKMASRAGLKLEVDSAGSEVISAACSDKLIWRKGIKLEDPSEACINACALRYQISKQVLEYIDSISSNMSELEP